MLTAMRPVHRQHILYRSPAWASKPIVMTKTVVITRTRSEDLFYVNLVTCPTLSKRGGAGDYTDRTLDLYIPLYRSRQETVGRILSLPPPPRVTSRDSQGVE